MSTYSAYTDFSQLKSDCLSSCSAYCQKNQPENALSQLLLAAYYEFSGCIDNYTAYCYGLQGIYSKKRPESPFRAPLPGQRNDIGSAVPKRPLQAGYGRRYIQKISSPSVRMHCRGIQADSGGIIF